MLAALNTYTYKSMSVSGRVAVVERVTDDDELEVYCPDVVNPGEFFNCRIDIPTGNHLQAKIEMSDDLIADYINKTDILVPGTSISMVFVSVPICIWKL